VATFGHVGLGVAQSPALVADQKRALLSTAPEDGTVTEIVADMQNSGTEIQAVRAFIYNGTPSTPTTLLGSSGVILLAPGMVRTWVSFTGFNASIVAGSSYWIGTHTGAVGGNATYWRDDGVGTMALATDVFDTGTSATFGTAAISATSPAIYANYTAVGQQTRGLSRVVFSKRALVA
jgi:hypothetical protein